MTQQTPDDAKCSNVDAVLLAAPRGFCAGVEMAIKALAWMVRTFPAPVYCFQKVYEALTGPTSGRETRRVTGSGGVWKYKRLKFKLLQRL